MTKNRVILFPLALVCFLTLVSLSPSQGQGSPSKQTWIVFPSLIVPPEPPLPTAIPRLEADQLYVLDCKEPCFAFTAPEGIFRVTQEPGPIRIRGKFVGGAGKTETRNFSGKVVVVVELIASGTIRGAKRAEVVVIREGAKTLDDVFRQTLDSGSPDISPDPPKPDPPKPDPPKPDPPKPDPPKPPPAPIARDGLHVLIVEETADRSKLPATQLAILFDKRVRDLLKEKCANDPSGTDGKAYRIYDQNVDISSDHEVWQSAMKRPRRSTPWLILSNHPKGGFEGPLPQTVDETIAAIKKVLGE